MFIDKFKKDDGYYDKDNIYYEDAETFISTGIFSFCGCGMPDEALKYIKDSLELVNDLTKVHNKEMTYIEWEDKCNLLFNNVGSKYFMWYFLDNHRLTEHGGSVPGWLTLAGIELLSDLRDLYKEEKTR